MLLAYHIHKTRQLMLNPSTDISNSCAMGQLSLLLLTVTIGTEAVVLFHGYPPEISDLVVGRVLGLMDAVAMLVLSYWYGTTNGSAQKSELLAQKAQT